MVKKIKKHVERHYDDLGDDLSGLGKLEIDNLFVDIDPTMEADMMSDSASSDDHHANGFQYVGLVGTSDIADVPETVMIAATLQQAMDYLSRAGPGLDSAGERLALPLSPSDADSREAETSI